MDLFSIYAGLKLVTAPVAEPITLEAMESYLRVSSDSGGPVDQDILDFITVARQTCESAMRRAILRQTWQLSLKNWPGRDYQNWPEGRGSDFAAYHKYDHVPLPYAAPLGDPAAVVVTYKDTSATPLTMPQGNIAGGYNVDVNFEPARIVLPFSQIWPTTILLPGAPIQIVYPCGYDDAQSFIAQFEGAAAVLHAMKMMTGYAFENKIPPSEMRRASIDAGLEYVIEQLLQPYRIY